MDESAEIAISTIQDLLDGCEREIEANDNHILSLQEVNDGLKQQAKTFEKTLAILREKFGVKNATPDLVAELQPGRYSDMGLNEAVMDVISRFGNPPGLTANDILSFLHREGFKSDAKKPYYSVYGVARDLVAKDKIAVSDNGEQKLFMRKQPF